MSTQEWRRRPVRQRRRVALPGHGLTNGSQPAGASQPCKQSYVQKLATSAGPERKKEPGIRRPAKPQAAPQPLPAG